MGLSDPTTARDRLRLYAYAQREPRFLALYSQDERYGIDEDDRAAPFEGFGIAGHPDHPTVFRTFRNAKRAAGERGLVLIFDPSRLPVVGEDVTFEAIVDETIELCDELAFAERQMLLWQERVLALMKGTR